MFDLSLEMLRVVENAAVASARTMGMGNANASDQAAVESMRRCLDTLAIEGTIVIGEGERDEAPMQGPTACGPRTFLPRDRR
jgi:fructose-1,6-bisphosphatase/sedoheptulose 1,7-bisphosphatase-like protein